MKVRHKGIGLRRLVWWWFVIYNVFTFGVFAWRGEFLSWGVTVLVNAVVTVMILWAIRRSRSARYL